MFCGTISMVNMEIYGEDMAQLSVELFFLILDQSLFDLIMGEP